MPKKNGGVYCLNHPAEEMRLLDEGQKDVFHAVRLASIVFGKRLQMENKSTLFSIFACPRCGYAELYLPLQELALLNKK